MQVIAFGWLNYRDSALLVEEERSGLHCKVFLKPVGAPIWP